MKRLLLICTVIFATLASGCSLLPSREQPWAQAQQEKPLKIPLGMNVPSSAAAMHVADVSASASQLPVNKSGMPPGLGNGSAETAVSIPGGPTTSQSLLFSDTPDSVYRRVGMALRRGDMGTVTASAVGTHQYVVKVKIIGKVKPENKGFFSRIFSVFSHHQTQWVEAAVKVQIQADGKQSQVVLKGPAEAVSKVRAVLTARLAGN
ncbi:MAG TPA: hypothetical protein ENI75_00915 [Mizugakiibacter sp.]|nr:hypothetical protein [Mizugakiibacter sp.]